MSDATGCMSPYPGLTPPAGYLLCDGAAYLESVYPDLYGACTFSLLCGLTATSADVTTTQTTHLRAGMVVSGPGVFVGTTIVAVNPGVGFTMSAAAAFTSPESLTFYPHGAGQIGPYTGDVTSGSQTVANLSSVAGLAAGAGVTGHFIPPGTTILSVSGNTLTLSDVATGTGNVSLTFWPVGGFNVPNCVGRVPLMTDPTGLVLSANKPLLGQTGGEERHVSTLDETAPHSHPQELPTGATGGSFGTWGFNNTTGSGATPSVSPPTGTAGGGKPHNNMQPWIALNWLIKT